MHQLIEQASEDGAPMHCALWILDSNETSLNEFTYQIIHKLQKFCTPLEYSVIISKYASESQMVESCTAFASQFTICK